MSDAGVLIGWDKVAVGREKQAMVVWTEALAFYDKARANGEIEKFDVIGFEGGGSTSSLGLLGAIVARGSESQLDTFIASDEFGRQMQRASLVVDHLHVNRFVVGDRMLEVAGKYFQEVDALLG
jgi:hypothetical protein